MDFHAETPKRVLDHLKVSPGAGLSEKAARERRARFGPNTIAEQKHRGALAIFVEQFRSVVILLLLGAAVAALLFDRTVESIAIAVALLVNAAVGFTMEYQAVRSMAALQRMTAVNARCRREGRLKTVRADDLVPGDIVLLEPGDQVSADLRLIETEGLSCDESALTGESSPVAKSIEPLGREASVADRINMAFKGTAVTQGAGIGVVVATGMDTEIGRVSSMVQEAKGELTPLERRLEALGRRLVWLTLAVAAVVLAAGLIAGKSLVMMLETAIALAVAAVPEGLPVVATVALARGMRRMAARNALVKQLAAVEALGAATVIMADKTGTLTENRMTLGLLAFADGEMRFDAASGVFMREGQTVATDGAPRLRRALAIGALCSNARLGDQPKGDPMEVALLEAAERGDGSRDALLERWPERREEPFSSETNMMATIHAAGEGFYFAVKGAPEAVLEAAAYVAGPEGEHPLEEAGRERWRRHNEDLASRGLRVLALAEKRTTDENEPPYQGLTLIALAGLVDPPRGGVKEAVDACHDAGIDVVMITGDQPATAGRIAAELGISGPDAPPPIQGAELRAPQDLDEAARRHILRATVFARVNPEQKLDIVHMHQQAGAVVAMTGDGINDAPALKKADVGVAMGRRGTDVAREAADMVLRDDAFTTIVAAIEQGRTIFDNIRRFIVYLLSGNLGEIIAVSLAAASAAPLPLLPLQILYINFVNDVLPALALGMGHSEENVMRRPPRQRSEPLVTGAGWAAVFGYGFIIAGSALGALAYALLVLGLPVSAAVTVSFLTFGFSRLWHVFNMRAAGSSLLRNSITRNGFVWLALGVGTMLLLAAVYLPGLNDVLGAHDPGPGGWLTVFVFSILPLLLVQPLKWGGWLWEGRWLHPPRPTS